MIVYIVKSSPVRRWRDVTHLTVKLSSACAPHYLTDGGSFVIPKTNIHQVQLRMSVCTFVITWIYQSQHKLMSPKVTLYMPNYITKLPRGHTCTAHMEISHHTNMHSPFHRTLLLTLTYCKRGLTLPSHIPFPGEPAAVWVIQLALLH